jgi:signal transduction histidine kinase
VGLERFLRTHADACLAIALTLLVQAEVWLIRAPDPEELGHAATLGEQVVAAAAIGAFTISLAWRRHLPLAVIALGLIAAWLSPTSPLDASIGLAFAVVVATWSVGAGVAGRGAILGGLAVLALASTIALAHPGTVEDVSDVSVLLLIVGGPWVAGIALRLRRERVDELEARTIDLERRRDEEARRAVADERARIARELHDIVAHAISVIVLQARGGRRALATDPDEAIEALIAIEATGSQALDEMRRLMDVLRPADESPMLTPQPSLGALDGLVRQIRDSGLPVELVTEGESIELPAGIDLTAYRIVQEALTNALRHAGHASARVTVRFDDSGLEIEVTDSGTVAGSGRNGHGLVGMRERVSLYGGSVEAGPKPGGGFRVLARLPLTRGDG